jgi:hypothetical protein
VWAVDVRTGARQLVLEMNACGESEGLDIIPTRGGELHWVIAPFQAGCSATFGPSVAVLHFAPKPKHERYQVEVTGVDFDAIPGTVTATVHATSYGRPLRRAQVSFAGATARTDMNGVATIVVNLDRPGEFRAIAQRGQNYGASALVDVGVSAAAAPQAIPETRGH